jgi:hypothetical protein
MDAIDLLRFQVGQAQAWLEMTVSDITEEEANWQPPGIANSIGATYAHLIITADEDVNMLLYGGETLLATDWKGAPGSASCRRRSSGGTGTTGRCGCGWTGRGFGGTRGR